METFRVGKNDGPVWKPDWHLSPISAILSLERKAGIMCKKFTPDELNQMDPYNQKRCYLPDAGPARQAGTEL